MSIAEWLRKVDSADPESDDPAGRIMAQTKAMRQRHRERGDLKVDELYQEDKA